MEIKGVIFDLDGTLLDSMWYWDRFGEEFLAERGKTPLPDFRDKYYVYSTAATAEMIVEDYGLSETPEQVIQGMMDTAARFYRDRVQPKPFALDFMDKLNKAGVKMALATATEHMLVDIAVSRFGLDRYLSGIVTCTDVNASKTVPDVYLRALESVGSPVTETAVFEDALIAASSAKRAGFYTVGIYDGTAASNEKAMRNLCDEYIYDFSQVSDKFT